MPTLAIDITARYAAFSDSLDQVNRNVTGFSNKLNSAFSGVASSLAALGITAAVAGFAALAKANINAADEAGKAAQKFGLTAESLTELQYSAKLADVSNETLGQSLKKLSVNMFEAQSNTGEAKEAFKALGLSVVDSSGQLKKADQFILEIADKFAGMEDGAGKTALAVKALSKSGAEMIPLLNAGAKGLRENAEEARKFGIVISTDAAKGAEQFNDNLSRLSTAMEGLGRSISIDAMPWLNKMAERMVELVKLGGGLGGAFRILGQQLNVFAQPVENLSRLNAELKKLEDSKTNGTGVLDRMGSSLFGVDAKKRADDRIKVIKEQIKWETILLQGQVNDSDNFDAKFNSPLKNKAPGLPDEEAAKKAKAAREKAAAEALQLEKRFQAELLSLQDQGRKTDGAVGPFFDMQAKLRTEAFKELSAQRKNELLDGAALQQQREDIARQDKELFEGLQQNATEQAAARSKEITDLNAIKSAYADMGDPLRPLQRQLEDIERLQKEFPEQTDLWTNAWIRVQQQITEATLHVVDVDDKLKEIDNTAKDMGHAISTAFEDAVIGGKKATEVLGSFAKTLAQIVLRNTITKPLEKAMEGALSGGFGQLLASFGLGGASSGAVGWANAGSFATGTDYVPRTGLAMVHQGERIIPAKSAGGSDVTIINNNDFRGVDPMTVARIEGKLSTLERTIAARVKDAQRRSV